MYTPETTPSLWRLFEGSNSIVAVAVEFPFVALTQGIVWSERS